MRRLIPIFALLLGATPQPRLFYQPNLPRGSATPAFFEFAPASGAGMGAACACVTPTGAKGEAMTFSRASSATCLKTVGTAPQSVANGDMVTCTSGQARVMPGADGTSVSGLLVEPARTNVALRSQEFDNVAWSVENFSGAGAPTITADVAVAPDGTTTADRVQLPATSTAQASGLFQGTSFAAASGSLYVKGNGTSGAIDLALFGGSAYQCAVCSYNATTWTPCHKDNVNGGASSTWLVGNLSAVAVCGSGARGAADVFLWGAQWEVGAYVSSYIATTTVAVTRAADVAYFAPGNLAGSTLSLAATWLAPSAIASNVFAHAYVDANNSTELSIASTKVRGTYRIGGSNSTEDTAGAVTVSASNRGATYYDLTNKAACLAGICTTAGASLTLPTGAQSLYVGSDQAGANQLGGVVKQVCEDPSATRCR